VLGEKVDVYGTEKLTLCGPRGYENRSGISMKCCSTASSAGPSTIEALEPRQLFSGAHGLLHTTHSLLAGRDGALVTVVNGVVALINGGGDSADDVLELYNADTGVWSTTSPGSGIKLVVPPAAAADKVYCPEFPGTGQDLLDIYDLGTQQWSSIAAPQEVRYGAALAVGTKLVFAGGIVFGNQAGTTLDDVAIYDTVARQWSSATLSSARVPTAAVIGHKVIFAGGFSTDTSEGATAIDIYDADTGQWSTATLSRPLWDGAAVAVVGNKAIFAGGSESSSGQGTTSVDIYDASTGQWTTAKLSRPRVGAEAAVVGTKAIFTDGADAKGRLTDRVDIYDSATGVWSRAKLSAAHHPAVGVVAGTVALFAGQRVPRGAVRLVDAYDPTTPKHWSIAPKLSEARTKTTGATVGDQVIFVGGENIADNSASAVVDIYTLATAASGPRKPAAHPFALRTGSLHAWPVRSAP
jgi:N-acetylneuraminic acid mutarotase